MWAKASMVKGPASKSIPSTRSLSFMAALPLYLVDDQQLESQASHSTHRCLVDVVDQFVQVFGQSHPYTWLVFHE